MLECPRCDGQGSVMKAEIVKKNTTIFICDECEATWFSLAAIGTEPWVDYGTYMQEQRLSLAWDELTIQGEAA